MANWLSGLFKPKRSYDGAGYSRRTSGWLTRSTGPNAEIAPSLSRLRDRHRDLVRNNPWAGRAVQAVVNNAVGYGIQAQWTDNARTELWQRWFESTACDADGRADGYGLQSLALRTIVESGEVLIRRRPRRLEDRFPVPLQIQVLEPDYLDHAKTETTQTGGWITQGVEFNPFGQRIAYWLYPEHPGDQARLLPQTSIRYPAADFLHIYRVDRPGQSRGVPWGAGVMLRLKMLDDYADAQLERQRLAACYVAFLRESQEMADAAQAEAQRRGEPESPIEIFDALSPGAIQVIPPNTEMSFASPPPAEGYRDYLITVLQSVAAGYGVPYETLTGDLSQVNFSSARMGWNEFARNIDVWRWHMLIPQFLNPLAQWFDEAAGLLGNPTQPLPEWTPPARVMVDPTREIPAIQAAIRCGILTLPEAIRQQGYDPDTLINEQAAFLKKLDALGIQLDSDPRQSAKAPDVEDPAQDVGQDPPKVKK